MRLWKFIHNMNEKFILILFSHHISVVFNLKVWSVLYIILKHTPEQAEFFALLPLSQFRAARSWLLPSYETFYVMSRDSSKLSFVIFFWGLLFWGLLFRSSAWELRENQKLFSYRLAKCSSYFLHFAFISFIEASNWVSKSATLAFSSFWRSFASEKYQNG